jgi:hypothetical protein
MSAPSLQKSFLSFFFFINLHIIGCQLQAQSFLQKIEGYIQQHPPNGLAHYKFTADTLGDFHYPVLYSYARHHYLFHKGKMVIQLDGTGKLLWADSLGRLQRMDSTLYEGYNYGAFNFVYKDTIFSLGGYGFWQFNGQLRYFSEVNSSWSVVKSNALVPIRQWYNAQVYYDVADEKIYTIYGMPHEEWVMEAVAFDEKLYVQCLDLKTKLWWDKPKIADLNVFKGSGWAAMAMFNAPQGLIAFVLKEVKIVDFRNNRLGHINISKARNLADYWYSSNHLLMYSSGKNLHFINPAMKKIDTLPFSSADIEWTNISLYTTPVDIPMPLTSSAITVLILLTVASGMYWWKRKRTTQQYDVTVVKETLEEPASLQNSIEQQILEKVDNILPRTIPFSDTLTTVEKGLLDLILKNSTAGKMTSVIQVNEVLGIARKDVKSQNNIRAAALQMINHKFTAYSGLHDELIMKQRTEFDKRFFEYFIHQKFVIKLKAK